MNSKRVFQIGFFVLVILNVALIYLLLCQSNMPPRMQRPPQSSIIEKISSRLELNEAQEADYRLMAKEHGARMRSFETEQRELIKLYFRSFNDGLSSDSIKNEILKVESDKLQYNHDHFEELKSILTEEQKDRFGLIMNDILMILSNERGNRRPRQGDSRREL